MYSYNGSRGMADQNVWHDRGTFRLDYSEARALRNPPIKKSASGFFLKRSKKPASAHMTTPTKIRKSI